MHGWKFSMIMFTQKNKIRPVLESTTFYKCYLIESVGTIKDMLLNVIDVYVAMDVAWGMGFGGVCSGVGVLRISSGSSSSSTMPGSGAVVWALGLAPACKVVKVRQAMQIWKLGYCNLYVWKSVSYSSHPKSNCN